MTSGHVEREPRVGRCLFVRPEPGIESARTREAMDRVPRTSMRAAVTERCCDGLKGGPRCTRSSFANLCDQRSGSSSHLECALCLAS